MCTRTSKVLTYMCVFVSSWKVKRCGCIHTYTCVHLHIHVYTYIYLFTFAYACVHLRIRVYFSRAGSWD